MRAPAESGRIAVLTANQTPHLLSAVGAAGVLQVATASAAGICLCCRAWSSSGVLSSCLVCCQAPTIVLII